MDPLDKQAAIDRYNARLQEFGVSSAALGWGHTGKQVLRFAVLAREALERPNCSVLDIGCGFGDLYAFLTNRGWKGRYTGIDINPTLLGKARERFAGATFLEADVMQNPDAVPAHDFVIMSGVFNHRMKSGDTAKHVLALLTAATAKARYCTCADFLSTWVDFQNPDGWHTDPAWALSVGRGISRRLALRADYMPYEFSLFLYRDAEIDANRVFTEYSARAVDAI